MLAVYPAYVISCSNYMPERAFHSLAGHGMKWRHRLAILAAVLRKAAPKTVSWHADSLVTTAAYSAGVENGNTERGKARIWPRSGFAAQQS